MSANVHNILMRTEKLSHLIADNSFLCAVFILYFHLHFLTYFLSIFIHQQDLYLGYLLQSDTIFLFLQELEIKQFCLKGEAPCGCSVPTVRTSLLMLLSFSLG